MTSVTDPLSHTTTFAYDAMGNLTAVTDPLGQVTTLTYNPFGQPLAMTDPLGHTTQLAYAQGDLVAVADPLGNTTTRFIDTMGRLITTTNPLGFTTRYDYDVLNRLTKVTDARGGVTAFAYDLNGNLLSVTDTRSNPTRYTYDSMDRAVTRTDPLLRAESYQYDPGGNLTRFTDRKGQSTTFTYDALNRRTQAAYADGSTTTYTYDAGNRLTQLADSIAGTIARTYDTLDRLTAEAGPQGTVGYTYDAAGRRTGMSVPGQAATSYAYDNANRLIQISQGAATVAFAYDAASRRTSLTLPNGIVVSYGYDGAGHVTGITYQLGSTPVGDLAYAYDRAGNRIQVGGSWGRTGLPQPLSAATYDAANQIMTWGTASLTYDANGNLTNDGTNSYLWDARNHLASLTGPGVTGLFQYDPLGRRQSKTINGATTQFLYDGFNPVQELSGPTVTANTLSGLAIDEYFARNDETGTWAFLTDALGSTMALADNAGAIQTTYTYEPFGATTATGVAATNPFQFTSRENDITGLYYSRARYYEPGLQRFVSPDPLLCATALPLRSIVANPQSLNSFVYVGNSPLKLRDPLGLSPECSYYDGRCAEVPRGSLAGFYYCSAAKDVCETAPRGPYSTCVRECLQAFDQEICVPTFGRKPNAAGVLVCFVSSHTSCFGRCVGLSTPPLGDPSL